MNTNGKKTYKSRTLEILINWHKSNPRKELRDEKREQKENKRRNTQQLHGWIFIKSYCTIMEIKRKTPIDKKSKRVSTQKNYSPL